MKKLLFSGLILLILFLILVPEVLALEQDAFVTKWKSSDGDENQLNTIQNLAASDASTPITIVLTQSKIPLVNEETILHIEVNSIFDAPGTSVKTILPPNVELISGSLERIIDLQANTPESFETVIKFTQPGNFKITALAHKEIDQENSWGDMDVIYLTIGEVSSKISTFGPIVYAERAQSASGQSLRTSDVSTSPQNLRSEPFEKAMPIELPVDSNIKSVDLYSIYSPQTSQNYSVQSGTLTVTGQWTYYTKVIGGEIADYRDTDDTRVPLRHAAVAIYDDSYLFPTLLGYGYTDNNGNFSINIANPYPLSFNVHVWAYSNYIDTIGTSRELRVVSQGNTLTGFTDVWTIYAGPFSTTDGAHTQNIGSWYPTKGNDYEHAFMLFQDLIRARDFIGWDIGSSTILWYPTSNDGTYYEQGGQIHLLGEDYISADTSIHEFGHNYMWTKKGYWVNTCPSPHYIHTGDNPQCAYKEGWATILPLAINGNPNYTWASGDKQNLETPTWGTPDWDTGDDCSGRVAGALWDMYDNVNDGFDEYQYPYSFINTTMMQNSGWTFYDFWNTWKSLGYSSDAEWSIYQNTIDYFPPPTIINISPASGLNNSTVHTTIIGSDFLFDPLVGLSKNNIPWILATQYTLNSPQNITCDFNLNGVEAGQWNVVVVNLGGQYGILNNGFTILNTTPMLSPVANFTATPTSGQAPLAVQFNDTSTNSPTSWNWSFGDAPLIYSTEQNPAHTYSIAGNYFVLLNVTNSAGSSNKFTAISVVANDTPYSMTGNISDGGILSANNVDYFTIEYYLYDLYGNPIGNRSIWVSTNLSGETTPTLYTTDLIGQVRLLYGPKVSPLTANITAIAKDNESVTNNLIAKFVSSDTVTPAANFTANVSTGNTPLSVKFMDTTSNNPTTWNWSFTNITGNNTLVLFSTAQNPVYTFSVGNYSIVLNASNSAGYNLSKQVTFINVIAPIYCPISSFTPNVTSGTAPLTVQFNDSSTNFPTAWKWSYTNVTGNDTQIWFSTQQNPAYTFGVGNYSIVLNASNSAGYDLSNQVTFINVTAPITPTVSKIGVNQKVGVWLLDSNGNFVFDNVVIDKGYHFGFMTPVYGDWNGDGKTEIGDYDNGYWYLDYNGNGTYDGGDRSAIFGPFGYNPVVGDWDGTGYDKIGVEKDGIWAVDYNGNYQWDGAVTDRFAALGQVGDIPVVGDWDGTGKDKIGSHKDGFWAVDYNGNYLWDGAVIDRFAGFGQTGDKPVIGDWDGTGKDKIGMEKDGFWGIDYNGNYLWDGAVIDKFAGFGQTSDTPVVGDWDGNGKTKIGSFKDGFWAIDFNGNYLWDGVIIDKFTGFGKTGDTPVVGKWA